MTDTRVPVGEYVVEQRRIRFRVDPPWPLPGDRVLLKCSETYSLLVRLDDIGGDGWLGGALIGKRHGKRRVVPLRGYD